jgi:hypothetical protein
VSVQLAKINVQLVDCGKTLQPIISGRYTLQLSIVPGVKYKNTRKRENCVYLLRGERESILRSLSNTCRSRRKGRYLPSALS